MKLTLKITLALLVPTLIAAGWLYGRRAHLRSPAVVASNPLTANVDSLCAHKKDRLLIVYSKGQVAKQYHISLGPQPVGAKHFEGDGKTPEGLYHISVKNSHSKYHLSLKVSYPCDADRTYARTHNKNTGGDVMIHGLPNDTKAPAAAYAKIDWTAGCMAVNNPEIEELFAHVTVGTPIRILP